MRTAIALFSTLSLALIACGSDESSQSASRSVTRGAFTVSTEARGNDLVSRASKTGTDDALTITFDRAAGRARIEPKYGQAQSVELAQMPSDADAANELLLQPLTFAADKASSTAKVAPQTVTPPPPACTNPCFDACDAKFSNAAQNAACRFGCSTACVQ